MTRRKFRAATRGSALALWQTQHIADLAGIDIEPVVVQTEGDRTQKANVPIDAMRGQGVFVKEVEAAVLAGHADFAVHSAKDLPSETENGLALACVPERGDPRDALVGRPLDDLAPGAVVATGSVRRRAQIASLRPDLTFATLRGNIDTRLRKAGNFDAIVIAYAALQRLDRTDVDVHVLSPDVVLPQVAQGALAVECRVDDDEMRSLFAEVEHAPSRTAVDAERAFLAALGGGCDLPAGAYAVTGHDGTVQMRALIASLDGHVVLRANGSGVDGASLGRELADRLLNHDGGNDLLAAHRKGRE